jgi:phage terminase Nu1 subunit (DNA packaging protein)
MKHTRKQNLVNQTALAAIFGVEQSLVALWTKNDGCPVHVDPNATNKKNVVYNTPDVLDWYLTKQGLKADFNFERTRLTKYQADKLFLELEEKRGGLIEVNAVEKLWINILTNIRTKLLNVPKKIAPLFSGIKSEFELETEIESTIRDCLDDLATNTTTYEHDNSTQAS